MIYIDELLNSRKLSRAYYVFDRFPEIIYGWTVVEQREGFLGCVWRIRNVNLKVSESSSLVCVLLYASHSRMEWCLKSDRVCRMQVLNKIQSVYLFLNIVLRQLDYYISHAESFVWCSHVVIRRIGDLLSHRSLYLTWSRLDRRVDGAEL